MSCRTEDAGDSTTLLYSVIRLIFRATGFVFYATTECHGVEDFPAAGEPTLLCFNHGNGLADPLCLIKATPRMVRFCAKDTLWKVPIMGTFIRNSGAVPIYRQREHGDQAKDRNLEVFRTVIEVLRAGGCLGFAPEGVSRFLPYMEQPFKTGVARIALEAVRQSSEAGDADFKVNVVPVGLAFTHREKFRSDLCMSYCKPIVVDAAYAARFGDSFEAAKALTCRLSADLEAVTINAPDWGVIRCGITAARLHQAADSQLTLKQYLSLLRGWVEVLKLAPADASGGGGGGALERDAPKASALAAARLKAELSEYQRLLDEKGIKDERVRRAAAVGQALPWYWCAWGLAQRAVLCSLLFAVATPGLVAWMPVWVYVKRRERMLMAKGPRWNDSVAETKMMVCALIVMAFVLGCLGYALLHRSAVPLAFIAYLYATMRLYEEAVADARSCYSLYKLLFLRPSTMAAMVQKRKAAKAALDAASFSLPDGVASEVKTTHDEALPKTSWRRAFDFYFPWWLSRLLVLFMRRRKKDWNEVLRLEDHNTMDYVE